MNKISYQKDRYGLTRQYLNGELHAVEGIVIPEVVKYSEKLVVPYIIGKYELQQKPLQNKKLTMMQKTLEKKLSFRNQSPIVAAYALGNKTIESFTEYYT